MSSCGIVPLPPPTSFNLSFFPCSFFPLAPPLKKSNPALSRLFANCDSSFLDTRSHHTAIEQIQPWVNHLKRRPTPSSILPTPSSCSQTHSSNLARQIRKELLTHAIQCLRRLHRMDSSPSNKRRIPRNLADTEGLEIMPRDTLWAPTLGGRDSQADTFPGIPLALNFIASGECFPRRAASV